jgi:hypothetical protein
MPAYAANTPDPSGLGFRRIGGPTVATPSEITGLTIALTNTNLQIDRALDQGDRRAFRLWCQRRRSLLAKLERTLLAVATAEVPA